MPALKTVPFNDRLADRLQDTTPPSATDDGGRKRAATILALFASTLACLMALAWLGREPASLPDSTLTGARSPAPVSVVILLDESGSFQPYQDVRRHVVEQLTTWAPSNLRDDDTLTIVSFAGDAVVRMPTSPVGDLVRDGFTYHANTPAGSGTQIQPALTAALHHTQATQHATSFIVVTDTQVTDLEPGRVENLMKQLGASSMSLIVPSGVDVDSNWEQVFAWQEVFRAEPDSVDQVAVAVGKALAHTTGQRLVRNH